MKDFIQVSREGRVENLEKFLQENPGTNINQKDASGGTALYYAAYKGEQFVAKFLLEKNADVNVVTKSKQSALIIAIKNANLDIANMLLGHEGIDVNIADESGLKALDYAREIVDESVRKDLVKKIAKAMPLQFQDRVDEITPLPSPANGSATPASSPGKSILKQGRTT